MCTNGYSKTYTILACRVITDYIKS